MPLKIHLRKGQKIIINGAVLENVTTHNVSLLVMNDAAILRDTDVLTPDDAVTPSARAYYALQCLYLFPGDSQKHLPVLKEFLESYLRAAPSSKPIIDEIFRLVDDGRLYKALKKGQDLIAHEQKVLSHVHQTLSEELRDAASGGESEGDGGLGADAGGRAHESGEGDR
ncbi:MAG: flagellar biosynthesis repressor FlbT [Hyphomicrobiales bacterium]|nr:flagellar biosynthesis repressor FlbT [Hyphomicrobiales bacterium]